MIAAKAVKSTALATLKGRWLWGSFVSLLPWFGVMAVALITTLFSPVIGRGAAAVGMVLIVTLIVPLFLGALRTVWRGMNDVFDAPSAVFCYFSSGRLYIKAFTFSTILFAILAVTAFVALLPATILQLLATGQLFEWLGVSIPPLGIGFRYLANLLTFVGSAVVLVRMFDFYLAPFFFVSMEELPPKDCIRLGQRVARYTKVGFMARLMSFFGWFVLSVLVVPLAFTVPYGFFSYAVDCRFSTAYYNRLGSSERFPTYHS